MIFQNLEEGELAGSSVAPIAIVDGVIAVGFIAILIDMVGVAFS